MTSAPRTPAPETVLLDWLLEHASIGVCWSLGDGFVQVNAEGERILGLSHRRLQLEAWNQCLSLRDATGQPLAEGERPLVQALRGNRRGRERMQVVRPDGKPVDVGVEVFPLRRGGGLVLFEDISWSLDLEKRCDEWMGALGHELNGVLQGLGASARVAATWNGKDPERTATHLEVVQRQTRHMGRLVRDFIDAARLRSGGLQCRFEPVPLRPLLEELVGVARLSDSHHRIQLESPGEVSVFADPDRLRQILTNLLSNAAKYATPGAVRLGAREAGGRVLLWLSDDGPGIPRDAQPTLFQRYARLPSRRQGTGLGLWISREIARRMGGELWFESDDGHPTTFYLTLPAALPAAIASPG